MPRPRRLPRRKMRKARRVRRRGYSGRTTTLNINRALQPIPQRYICKMKYCETVQMNLSNAYSYSFNLNSIWDPNRTSLGHQPYSHDTFQTLYNRYRVIGATYTVQVFNANNTCIVGAMPANEVITFATTDEIMENPRTKWIAQSAGGGIKVLRGKVYLPSLVGRSKTQYMSDDRYQAQFGASPSELAVLNLACSTITGADVTVDGTITITYLVECFDVKHLAQS